MKIEVWKTYPEFSFIEVSPFGDVRTLDRVVTTKRGTRIIQGHILKQWRNKDGYMQVSFNANGKTVTIKVHRLVAQTFIPNPDNLPQVNHKDCNRTNNNVDNLEWCDASYNRQYTEKYGVSSTESRGHSLYAINLNTLEVFRFKSQSEASRELEVSQPDITKVIKGQYKTAGGYWFTEDNGNGVEADKDKLRKIKADINFKGGVFAINLKTQEASRFESQSEASRELEVNLGNINSVIKDRLSQTKGYWFTNADNKAVETTRDKLGDIVASKVEKLMKRKTNNIK
ncbi:HNH endonuclease [Lactobacillus phage Iacchus]|uniref:HNH homing endonuclease n=1 Tax=Lactobacillus phage Iacchus TaxID=2315483 RepID=A0A3Q8HX18_9CAUD|nr:HNH endonuclease [Lactobacillus phage Iacchus]AYH92038.1 HNH homing endonuclease [Lactobacillus phage Iacchus]AYH92210.1 HNH homing endonuclease [Lactobacillus phage Dionysus]